MTPVPLSRGEHGIRQHRMALVLLTVTIVVSVVALVWLVVVRKASPAEPRSRASLTATSIAVHQSNWPGELEATGSVAPWQEAIIGAQVSGLSLSRLEVDVGDVVHHGQVLARFDTATLEAEFTQIRATLVQALALAAQADANRSRVLRLREVGGISEQDSLRYATEAATARAQVAAVRAQLEAKALQLRQANIVAPDDGVISSRLATVGMVSSNGQELFRLVRQQRLEWRGEFTAEQIGHITLGQKVWLKIGDDQRANGKVRQISPLLDERSRLATVYVDLEPGGPARGGMYLKGFVELPVTKALSIPAGSLVIRDGRSIVFRLDSADAEVKVRSQQVVTGRRHGAEVEVLSGLTAGELVVGQGAGLLSDGDVIRIVNSTRSAGVPAATRPPDSMQ